MEFNLSRTLPPHPHPDHLRRQARELLRAWRAGDPTALARAAPYRLPAPRLAGAQLVLARELGFTSWRSLLDEVEQRRAQALPEADYVERLLTAALGRGHAGPQPALAQRLLQARRPTASLPLALAVGDLPRVRAALQGADLAAPLPPWQAPPLVYAAFSSLARLQAYREPLLATVHWLLQAGADPNGALQDPAFPGDPLPVLYGAVARAQSLALVQRLLAAGAEPNDRESLYHATELTDRRILAALVQAGARWQGTNALLRQLDHDDLPGLQQALSLGADADEAGPGGQRPLHHALLRGRDVRFVRLLLQHGADARALDEQGRSTAGYAARAGDAESLALLLEHGATLPRTDEEAFLSACAAGDEAAARAHLAQFPDALGHLGEEGLRLLPDQAQRGHLGAVRLMLSLGWPVAVRGDWAASALNQAAFRGDAVMVRVLMQHGARWDEPNGFGGDALGSCLHAACHQPQPGGDYAAVLAQLLDQGAPAPDKVDELPEALQAVLAERPA